MSGAVQVEVLAIKAKNNSTYCQALAESSRQNQMNNSELYILFYPPKTNISAQWISG